MMTAPTIKMTEENKVMGYDANKQNCESRYQKSGRINKLVTFRPKRSEHYIDIEKEDCMSNERASNVLQIAHLLTIPANKPPKMAPRVVAPTTISDVVSFKPNSSLMG
jgi:hypothetical protein